MSLPADHVPIQQGDIYWISNLDGFESGIAHPYVIVKATVLNNSRIPTVVACALTSNLKRVSLPGNVLLEAGEANLPKSSVVEVSKVSIVLKTELGDYLGTLGEERVEQILAGMRFVQFTFE